VTWRFTSLDPSTLQLTTDASAGFLPPDVTPPQGIGRILYNVHPKTGLAGGTVICNQASIVFDANPAIGTPNWCNTVDDTPPTSAVQALPANEASASFNVQWIGTDLVSGINSYSIYVSDNGGAYKAWLTNTTLTSSVFNGVMGHSYAFYSIATDNAGNVEPQKAIADAQTTVAATSCANDVTAQFSVTRSGFRLNNTTQHFQQIITITRSGAGSTTGPFALALNGLSPNATLYGAAGITACFAPGSPYVLLNPGASWASRQTVSITLDFVDPTKTGITYMPVVLSGTSR
jgi:hypothetical protein